MGRKTNKKFTNVQKILFETKINKYINKKKDKNKKPKDIHMRLGYAHFI